MSAVRGRFTVAGWFCHSSGSFGLSMPKPRRQVIPWTLFVKLQRELESASVGVAHQRRTTYKSGGARVLFLRPAVLTSESTVEKSVDCPPTVPQYCCCTPWRPP